MARQYATCNVNNIRLFSKLLLLREICYFIRNFVQYRYILTHSVGVH